MARMAVKIGVNEGGGWMATILRKPGETYQAYYDKVPLQDVANSSRTLPPGWISDDELDVTDDFVRYAKPLIGEGWPEIRIHDGLQRFARIEITLIDKLLPDYIPVRYR